MSARITPVCCLLSALFLFPAFGQAQDAPEAPAEADASGSATQGEVERLKSELGSVTEEEPLSKREFEQWKKTAFEELKHQVSGPETELTPVEPIPDELDGLKSKVEEMERSVEDLAKIAFDQNAKLGAIAKKVSQGDADTWVPDVSRAWENEQFRQDMRRAVHGSMDRLGTLWIHNNTAVGHTVLVNNSHYLYVGPGQDRSVESLPVGTFSTELVGYERPRNWTLAPPGYEQHINIVPHSPTRVVAARPVSGGPPLQTLYSPPVYSPSVFVSPPVIVDPPVVWLW